MYDVFYTDAPPAYDYAGVERVITNMTNNKGRPIYRVETPKRLTNIQQARYASGLHFSINPSQIDEFIELGIIQLED